MYYIGEPGNDLPQVLILHSTIIHCSAVSAYSLRCSRPLEGSARTRPPRLLDAPHNDRRQCATPALSHTTAGLVRACGWQVGLQLYSSTATKVHLLILLFSRSCTCLRRCNHRSSLSSWGRSYFAEPARRRSPGWWPVTTRSSRLPLRPSPGCQSMCR